MINQNKAARSLLVLLLFLFFIQPVKPQENRQPAAADFTLTDIHGNTYNLYTELSSGKTVVLDFFSISCGSCATSVPVLSSLWHENGGYSSDLWVWGVEVFSASDAEIDTFEQENGGDFPCFSNGGNDSIIQAYDIQYTPRFYVVCPDKRRVPSLLGDLQLNIDFCRQFTEVKKAGNEPAVVFSSDQHNLYFSISKNFTGLFEMYNSSGIEAVKEKIYGNSSGMVTVPKTRLTSGIYLYRTSTLKGVVYSGKVIIF